MAALAKTRLVLGRSPVAVTRSPPFFFEQTETPGAALCRRARQLSPRRGPDCPSVADSLGALPVSA
jgi:hypothetical protein